MGFATGNLRLSYNFNEMVALRLGYRYLHEDEVPAHVAELGLDFEFSLWAMQMGAISKLPDIKV